MVTKSEVEHKARQKYGVPALVFPFRVRNAGEPLDFWGLSLKGQIMGCRRSLDELPALIERGPAMQAIGSK